jgi:elongation factor Ts
LAISASLVKELREKTGAGVMECRKALESSNGNIEEAAKLLHQQGMQKAAKKSARTTGEGQIGSYIHFGGKIGVLVEVNCETDFVARTDDFQQLIKDLAMHVAAINPKYLSKEDVPQEVLQEELEIYKKQARESGKPDNIIEKIAQGKLEKFYKSVCFLEQSFIKDENKTISELMTETIAKLGENIKIARFVRFEVGQ